MSRISSKIFCSLITEKFVTGSLLITIFFSKDFTFKYNLHTDERGAFAEILKAGDYGQVSFFTCKPGQTRGEHFHDTKNERFFVVSGKALFKFKDPITKKISQLTVSHTNRKAVHTIPGIVHNIKNIGKSELVVRWKKSLNSQ